MDDQSNLVASIHATEVAQALYAAHWTAYATSRDDDWVRTQEEVAAERFRKLADALGYRVEKIASDADPVPASPADAINAVRADLAELAGRVA